MIDERISLTIGPKKGLEQIIDDNPDRQFKLFHSTGDKTEYMLLDCSGKKSIFHSDLDYYIINEINPGEFPQDYLECRYLTLNKDEQKVFKSIFNSWKSPEKRPAGLDSSILLHALDDDFKFLLLNEWEDEDAFMVWDNDDQNQLCKFAHNSNETLVVKTYYPVK
ncbi:hypothetical protein ACWCL1_07860 [Ligilactobacillus sp. LYQ135]